MERPRTRGARSIDEAPPERSVVKLESKTHGVGLQPPTYATVDQFDTLQTQMKTMMALLQIHTISNHVSPPPIPFTEKNHVEPPQVGPHRAHPIHQPLAKDLIESAID
ncbi:hypothetical protein Adt_18533 [Abeliophyllum distichum]|uniref:Uncharacterized protein n=1 Tax=Abeliophyllum distichum TaxID=126358 RepID=A0ABD1TK05_9LAMI